MASRNETQGESAQPAEGTSSSSEIPQKQGKVQKKGVGRGNGAGKEAARARLTSIMEIAKAERAKNAQTPWRECVKNAGQLYRESSKAKAAAKEEKPKE